MDTVLLKHTVTTAITTEVAASSAHNSAQKLSPALRAGHQWGLLPMSGSQLQDLDCDRIPRWLWRSPLIHSSTGRGLPQSQSTGDLPSTVLFHSESISHAIFGASVLRGTFSNHCAPQPLGKSSLFLHLHVAFVVPYVSLSSTTMPWDFLY